MTDTKPTFTHLTSSALEWWIECYINARRMAQMSHQLQAKGIPNIGDFFCQYYNVSDTELSKEKDPQKQVDLIKKKYVK